jgi:hypothetical protein
MKTIFGYFLLVMSGVITANSVNALIKVYRLKK